MDSTAPLLFWRIRVLQPMKDLQMATPNDVLYDDQWHLKKIGNIEKIWADYDGSGVSVGIYDDGVEYTHEDLAGNYDASLHFTYFGVVYDPSPIYDDSAHGTACAGLIGAVSGNAVGGTGVAPGVSLTGVNYLDALQLAPSDVYDAAMRWAKEFDIVSNSWGSSGRFTYDQNLAYSGSDASADVKLWNFALNEGRDGLGTIIVKAAGNETRNTNGDGWNVARSTIVVAATDESGDVQYYSNFGSSVLISAPAASVTTDLTGSDGYNGYFGDDDPLPFANYTSTFGGTSAATPVTAGVVALMLDANSGLGWRDVQTILALSASHTGSDISSNGSGYEVGKWHTVGGNSWNGGGTMFHQSYGYGQLDAYGAVRMAEAWKEISPKAQTSANEQLASGNYLGGNVVIQDNSKISVSVNVSKDITVETIDVTLTLTHSDASDLNIWLVAPDGTRIKILNEGDARASTTDSSVSWVFGVDSLKGYSSEGKWKIQIQDAALFDSGILQDVSIKFHGAKASNDTLFHFTDDFNMLRNYESSRRVINDKDGGEDWLNFAAKTGSVTLNMKEGQDILVNGKAFAKLASGQDEIENAFMGDGKDKVTGNTLDNIIFGMRGGDKLSGAGGDDKLHGGIGNDTLNGGVGDDQLYGEGGRDSFVFAGNIGQDRVFGFANNTDQLKLNEDLWGGGKSISQVINKYADVVGGNTVFDFGHGDTVTILGVNNTSIFTNDIIFI
jgi:subtilisin family serine protease